VGLGFRPHLVHRPRLVHHFPPETHGHIFYKLNTTQE
jgi:hypothetical protein